MSDIKEIREGIEAIERCTRNIIRERTIRQVIEIIDYYMEQCPKIEGFWLEQVKNDVKKLRESNNEQMDTNQNT